MTDQTEDTEGEDDPTRAWARALFAPDPDEGDEQQKPPDPGPANHVPGEGTNPTGEAHDMRAYVEALFYSHDD